ncbi:hypothetical protein FRC00_012312 [Tulasnella sp. 408]|nr:hypothetical protein FRC00_012312 [Tulasnella sp. 408]
MTDSTPAAQFIVSPPFDSESFGDCILRTPDGTKFKVVKAILYLGSTVFRDMFDMPPATGVSTEEAKLPIIPVGEDPETMQTLLQMLYPIEPPTIKSLSLAKKLIPACDKYFVNTTKVQIHLQRILSSSRSLKEDPLACYTLSWSLGLGEEAVAASRHLHHVDLSNRQIAKRIVSQSGNLDALTGLWDVKFRRERALDELLALAKVDQNTACGKHGPVTGTTREYLARKEALRRSLNVPEPICEDVEAFLGFEVGQNYRNCNDCKAVKGNFLAGVQIEVMKHLRRYPQSIQVYVKH